jgi:methionine synthase II (cobalamin-independent)
MPSGPHAALLVPGLATGIGSLPDTDPARAVDVVFSEVPRLPFAPQLPNRGPREGMLAQWLEALPEVTIAPEGSIIVDLDAAHGMPEPQIDPASHAGLVAFLDAARHRPDEVARLKVQTTGPLTLGVALMAAGMPPELAFERARDCATAWATTLQSTVEARLPASRLLLFLDEPALVRWTRDEEPITRDEAIDVLSSVLAQITCVTGVHVCGDGDVRIAHAAGPDVLGVTASDALIDHADVVMRHLEADGWIAWGAVPTDRPLGDSTEGPWRRLVGLWCDLTRRGCDPVRLRTHGLVTPACGLAGYGESQAVRALRIAREMAERIGDQAVAARLTVGA